ncbi:glyoxylase-like metal-dependent hydrolase (beta-lactamase superfamily II) [Streptomyces sp. 846.5]|nr:MBL fold metallo-hydrolase [Streptomyces sp. 846.5]TDU03684.1 glyoxylase-like metal-dependent hydrolase (beta-lactamase superfamily II) [Streptomyces sp. 846.5]
MSYHGAVKVGGTPAVRELPQLMITKVAVGPMNNNAYLLRCRATDQQLLIDAAAEAPVLLETVGGSLATVVTTHRHQDHWNALAPVVRATGARTAAGRLDAEGIPVPTDLLLDDGDTLCFGEIDLTVRHLVGHTPGAIVLIYDDPKGHPHLFTGDCLFPGGIGNTWGDTAAFTSLLDGVETKLFAALPDETWVYPGHGDDTTLGTERPNLAEWRTRGW